MKKTLRFLTFSVGMLLSMLCTQKANAQVTSITAGFNDSASNYCNTPANTEGYLYWSVQGTPDPLDSLTIYINYGDGSDLTTKVETQSQGSLFVSHTYTTTGNYQISITVTNTNSVVGSITGQTYTITNTCATINGTVWLDNDNDCIHDVGEVLLAGHWVRLHNTTTNYDYYAVIDNNGMYHAEVPDGFTYTIEPQSITNYNGVTPYCPVTGVATQAVSGMGTYTHDFGYSCSSPSVTDFSVFGFASNFRPGFTRPILINAHNNSLCTSYPATVTLELHPLLTYVATTWGPAPTVSGNTLTWNIASLSALTQLATQIQVYCDPTAIMNSILCNTAYITYGVVNDTIPANDTVEICAPVNNSYDPNDKDVSPMVDAMGTIENGEQLNFLVNFQNTGNDIAYNVVVVDTLSDNLDLATFHFIEASHPVNVEWTAGNVLNFRFENINLPDSGANEPASHGFLRYDIKAKNNLADGAVINNTAYIYFDFNPAIITNTTVNTIEIPTSVQNITNGTISAKVYPNPANNELTITTEGKNFSAQIYDVLGRAVATSVTNNGKAVINTSSLANGMYILTIKADGKEMTTKINVQH